MTGMRRERFIVLVTCNPLNKKEWCTNLESMREKGLFVLVSSNHLDKN